MKLIRRPSNKVHEELPGYFTVYGKEGKSVGVMTVTNVSGVFWYFGEDLGDGAEDITSDALNKLSEVYGEPTTAPCRDEAPLLQVYESASKTVSRLKAEQDAYAKFVEEGAVLESQEVKKR